MLHAVGNSLHKWQMQAEINRIYKVSIRPILTYGIGVVYGKTEVDKSTIERVSKTAARMALNMYTSEYEDALRRLEWPSISWMAAQEKLRLIHKYANNILATEQNPETTVGPTQMPIEKFITRQTARRSSRLSNGRDLNSVGQTSRLRRTQRTMIYEMVSIWNSLPRDTVSRTTGQHFLDDIPTRTTLKNSTLTVCV
jgi:hypothetical protein